MDRYIFTESTLMKQYIRNREEENALRFLSRKDDFTVEDIQDFLHFAILSDLPTLQEALLARGAQYDDKTLGVLAKVNNIDFLESIVNKGKNVSNDAYYWLAYHGHLDLLKRLVSQFHIAETEADIQISEGAASGGRVDILQWAYEKEFCMGNAMYVAAANGQVECMKLLYNEETFWGRSIYAIAKNGKVRSFLHDHAYPGHYVSSLRGWGCNKGKCYICIERSKALKREWRMDKEEYNSYFQWLPKETANDMLYLIKNYVL